MSAVSRKEGRYLLCVQPRPLPDLCPSVPAVGHPIPVPQCPQPTEEQVDHYHTLYMKALEQLFEEHKESCGLLASTHLTFIYCLF